MTRKYVSFIYVTQNKIIKDWKRLLKTFLKNKSAKESTLKN